MINLYSCCIRPCPQYKVLPPWCSPHYNLIKGDPAHAEAGRRCPWENYKKLWRDDLAGVQPCTTPVPLTLWQQNAFFCCNLSVWVYVKKKDKLARVKKIPEVLVPFHLSFSFCWSAAKKDRYGSSPQMLIGEWSVVFFFIRFSLCTKNGVWPWAFMNKDGKGWMRGKSGGVGAAVHPRSSPTCVVVHYTLGHPRHPHHPQHEHGRQHLCHQEQLHVNQIACCSPVRWELGLN